ADVGVAVAREWMDEKNVAMLADLMNSSVALGVMELTKLKNRIAIVNGASTSVITNEKCTPNSIHYTWDTYALARGTANGGVGRSGNQQVVGLAINLNDTKALGLNAAQGLLLTEAFYWDLNDETRAWSKRFMDKFGKMPTSTQAGNYSSTVHYLKAVAAAGT